MLLLNTCLTVRAHEANSHANRGWEKFTQKVIDVVAKTRMKGVVFLAWGSPAGKRVAKVDKQRHCILQSVHPSPLSAHKGFVSGPSSLTQVFLNGHCANWLPSLIVDISKRRTSGSSRDMAKMVK